MKKPLKKFNEPDLYYKAFHLYDEEALKELEDIISQIDNESSVMVKDDTFKKLLKKASLDYIELVLNSSICIKNILPEYTPLLFTNTFPRRKFENSQEMIRFIDIFCNNKMFDIDFIPFLEKVQGVVISTAKKFDVVQWLLEKNSSKENIHKIFELCLTTPNSNFTDEFLKHDELIQSISTIQNINVLVAILGSSKIYNLLKEKSLLDTYVMNSIEKEPLEILNFMWQFQNEHFFDFMMNHLVLKPNISTKLTIHYPDKLHFIEKLKLYNNLPNKLNSHTINKTKLCKI